MHLSKIAHFYIILCLAFIIFIVPFPKLFVTNGSISWEPPLFGQIYGKILKARYEWKLSIENSNEFSNNTKVLDPRSDFYCFDDSDCYLYAVGIADLDLTCTASKKLLMLNDNLDQQLQDGAISSNLKRHPQIKGCQCDPYLHSCKVLNK